MTSAFELSNTARQALQRGPVLIAVDFDGTLTPIAPIPNVARLSPGACNLLRKLSEAAPSVLAVVSGRSLSELRELVPISKVILAGNHGLEIEGCGIAFHHQRAADLAVVLNDVCATVAGAIRPWPGAFVEHKFLTATVHHRLVQPCEAAAVRRQVRRCIAPQAASLRLRSGKECLEILPKVKWHKGSAVEYIRLAMGFDAEQCICLGDDRTDETMFEQLPEAITVCVGVESRPTAARFRLVDSSAVLAFLAELAGLHQRQDGFPQELTAKSG